MKRRDLIGPSTEIRIAAYDSATEEKAVADYICMGDDDQKTINAAISCLGVTGTIVLSPGTYRIGHFTHVGEGYYGAIFSSNGNNRIKLMGESLPDRNNKAADVLFEVTRNCYDSMDPECEYAVFTQGVRDHSYIQIENIIIVTPGNRRKIIGIDARYAFNVIAKNVMVNFGDILDSRAQGDASFLDSHRAVEGCVGVYGTQGSNGGTAISLTNIWVYGAYVGIAMQGEHLIAMSCCAKYCVYGYYFNCTDQITGAYVHPITCINCADELNVNMPRFGRSGEARNSSDEGRNQAISLIDFNLEWLDSYAALGGSYATEDYPGTTRGQINYTIQSSYGGSGNSSTIPFWADGCGMNMRSINDAQKRFVTTAERRSYAPNYLQKVFDTDLQKIVWCIDPKRRKWVDANGTEC